MKRIALLVLLGLIVGNPAAGWCHEEQGWKSVSIRGGVEATQRTQYFHQYEVAADYLLPWSLRAANGFGLSMEAETSLGALHAAGRTGVLASVGPTLVLDKGGKGLTFKIGGNLYGVSRHSYGSVDLNGYLLFAGHVDLLYRFAAGPGIGYRFQHMSNGGLGIGGGNNSNTGLDLHMLELSWDFY
jgi:hypothetical protein